MGGSLNEQNDLLNYSSQIYHLHPRPESGRTDASSLLQVVIPNEGIICRKRSQDIEKDFKLIRSLFGNIILLTILAQPDEVHQSFELARTKATNVKMCLAS